MRLTLPFFLYSVEEEMTRSVTFFILNYRRGISRRRKILELLGNVEGHGRRRKKILFKKRITATAEAYSFK